MRERGSGSLFRERYRDRKTGQLKVCRTWMMKLWMGGKPLKRSARSTSRAVASKQLEHWKAQIRQGTYVPDADQTRFDDLVTLLLDEYRANARKSLERVKAAVDHLNGKTSRHTTPEIMVARAKVSGGGGEMHGY
jgi:hypothetical protein